LRRHLEHRPTLGSCGVRKLEALEQLVLDLLVLGERERARLERDLGLDQQAADDDLVVELELGLLGKPLGEPDRAAERAAGAGGR
jgi:hypothetical protein